MKVNFTEVEDNNYEALPNGTYSVNVTDGEVRHSQKSDSDYINWELTVTDGQFEGRKVWTNTSLQPHALFSLKGLLAATGKYDVDGELDFEIEDVIGSKVKVVLAQREYNGEMQNNVKRFKKVSDTTADSESSLLP